MVRLEINKPVHNLISVSNNHQSAFNKRKNKTKKVNVFINYYAFILD